MSRKWLLSLISLFASALILSTGANAKFDVVVNESTTTVSFQELFLTVFLSINNGHNKPVPSVVKVELLTPSNESIGNTETAVTLKRGQQQVKISLPLKSRDYSSANHSEMLWYRLHYRVIPEASTPIEGFISLSEITPELFELRVATSPVVTDAMGYRARVQAVHPFTRKPASGVYITASATITGERDLVLTASATTSSDGYADLDFQLPANELLDELELELEGRRGAFVVNASDSVRLLFQPHILISTDKPIYRPGQTVHTRALVLAPSRKVMANKNVMLKITDPQDVAAFSAELVTSRFGIVAAEWKIPEQTKLGEYRVEFQTSENQLNAATIKISRYELPNFVVNVKTDRPYYVKGEDATVTVNANYLFGEPVAGGHVRIVRQKEEEWDYAEKKYKSQPEQISEGELKPDGTFTVRLPLATEFKDLEDDYGRFRDLDFYAYLTDASTNRTEQRRFDIRLTREAVHVYAMLAGDHSYQSAGLPLTIYLSTFYADGTPARCDVIATAVDDDVNKGPNPERIVARFKTNQYGLAKISHASSLDEGDSSVTLKFAAKDRSGRSGSYEKIFEISDQPGIKITTPKTILAPGEPIRATITSTEPSELLNLDVARNWSVLHSQSINIRNGRAAVVIPYQPEFKNEISLAVYSHSSEEPRLIASRSLIYPGSRDLKINLRLDSKTYKPGETARLSFQAASPTGAPHASVLGVVAVDKAVDARAQTDLERWQRYGTFFDEALILNGYGDSLGSVTRNLLENLDMSKPVDADLDLAAEIFLNRSQGYSPEVFTSQNYLKDPRPLFTPHIAEQLAQLRDVLADTYNRTAVYPTDEPALRRLLSDTQIRLETLKDPWGIPYRPLFYTDRQSQVFLLECAGPDKQFDSDDDFTVNKLTWSYFRSTGELIDKAVETYQQRTGRFIRDFDTLRSELLAFGFDLNTLKDPWQKTYSFSFDINETEARITVKTIDPSAATEFQVWRSTINYFTSTKTRILAALSERSKTGRLPDTHSGIRDALLPSGIDIDNLHDVWGNKYYLVFTRFEQPQLKPAAYLNSYPDSSILRVGFRSVGPDGQKETADDFEVVGLASAVKYQTAEHLAQRRVPLWGIFPASTGIIKGTVADQAGAVVPGATVSLVHPQSGEVVVSDTTNESGRYVLRNVRAGIYDLRVRASGFMQTLISQVEVKSAEILELNLTLQVASAAEVVTVSAGADPLLTNSTSATTVGRQVKSLPGSQPIAVKRPQQFITPRLREFFPETLIWKPELATDSKGRAGLSLKLADNITTWRLSVIGSNEHGEVGVAETEIRTFQPFFAELEPPQVLTQGDQISLPVVVRNYLAKNQTVDLQLKPEPWFTLLSRPNKQISVPARNSSTQFFDIQATSATPTGTQRITAIGNDFSDAIEKPISVHHDGEEKSLSVGDLLRESTSLSLELPQEMIDNSARVEMRVYPNLMGHVWQSVEAIMQRPYGCGEQTISSTYPSLHVLRHLKQIQKDNPLAQKARRYLEAGYERLLGYRAPDGGFRYWQDGYADVALTAYAIRFLQDASGLIEIDASVIEQAQRWLSRQQQPGGNWVPPHSRHDEAGPMLTALVARALATGGSCKLEGDERSAALQKALNYLEKLSHSFSEPYLVASYSIAASASCQPERAAVANARLRNTAQVGPNGVRWLLETSTPFYGWGKAGHIETTALAIQALVQAKGGDRVNVEANNKLIGGALLFLLKEKDHYGVWHSTQATISVLNTLLSLHPAQRDSERIGTETVDVLVNEQKTTVEFPQQADAPVVVDISGSLRPGTNTINVKRLSAGSMASIQIAGTYWIPWKASEKERSLSESLRLEASCNKTEARVMEEITCNVKAERLDTNRFGMLLAEIGLPPGADVDRSSLESLKRSSSGGIDQFEVLPDRVVFYLWPRSGATEFSYKFRPRMAMNAKSAASVLYDYYNPEARVTVRPIRFIVK